MVFQRGSWVTGKFKGISHLLGAKQRYPQDNIYIYITKVKWWHYDYSFVKFSNGFLFCPSPPHTPLCPHFLGMPLVKSHTKSCFNLYIQTSVVSEPGSAPVSWCTKCEEPGKGAGQTLLLIIWSSDHLSSDACPADVHTGRLFSSSFFFYINK